MDLIRIEDLAVLCHIGVPEEERSKPQQLLISLELRGNFSVAAANDDIHSTINYFEVSKSMEAVCQRQPYKLIETLAERIASEVFTKFHPFSLRVEVKKFILPNARYVSYIMEYPR